MLRFIRVNAAERALVRDPVRSRWLGAGTWCVWSWRDVDVFDLASAVQVADPLLEAQVPAQAAARLAVSRGQVALISLPGAPKALVGPGRYLLWRQPDESLPNVARFALDDGVAPASPALEAVLPAEWGQVLEVPDGFRLIVSVDGVFRSVRGPGRWVVWSLRSNVIASVVDVRPLRPELPVTVWPMVDALLVHTVQPWERGVIVGDGTAASVVPPGRHALSTEQRQIAVHNVDLRAQELTITGQEVMSADNATLRLNVLVRYRVDDPVKAVASAVSVRDVLYSEAQLAARSEVAGRTVDTLLAERAAVSEALTAAIAARAGAWGLVIERVDVKDVVLPGDLKAIYNQVIEAEKRARANGIARREETAATRSLANTAKVLANNPTLLRLKELEALQEVAGKVGSVTIVASADDLLGRLSLVQ